MNKQKHDSHNLSPYIRSAIGIILLICLLALIFALLWEPYNALMAKWDLQEVKDWDLPSESDLIGFRTYSLYSGNLCMAVAEITIATNSSEQQVRDYYRRNHPHFGFHVLNGGQSIIQDGQYDGRLIYRISGGKGYDCWS